MRPALTIATMLGLLGGLPASQAAAQDLVPGVESLIEGLQPDAGLRRGIRLPATPAPDGTPLPPLGQSAAPAPSPGALAATTAPPGVAAVSLTVNFATGSAALTPQAEAVLDNLARALASPQLTPFRFRVEGHTDTVGSRTLNQALSEARAGAVRDYLVRRHRIAAARIEAVGLGEQQPLVPTPDETAEPRNRRVQILNLGG
ncbi:OmpA family protein [Falsiroseomonas sp. CW058]|uniref:OmpA family protein n=1 Tax=Falsiroseomonas sp. CW058 TaxID=3388664 RepID=UPI003D31BE9A